MLFLSVHSYGICRAIECERCKVTAPSCPTQSLVESFGSGKEHHTVSQASQPIDPSLPLWRQRAGVLTSEPGLTLAEQLCVHSKSAGPYLRSSRAELRCQHHTHSFTCQKPYLAEHKAGLTSHQCIVYSQDAQGGMERCYESSARRLCRRLS